MNLKGLGLLTMTVLAVASVSAEDKSCCAGSAKDGRMHCAMTYSKLNLSADQKTKLEKLEAQCNKAGCTKASMDNFMKSAQGILSKKQFDTLKAECARMCVKGSKA